MTGAIETVQKFVQLFNCNRIDDAVDMLADDVFYHNIPLDPLRGREAVRAFTRDFGLGTRWRSEWTMVAIAGHGDVVLTERIDAFILDDGRGFAIPLMGSFRVENGLIVEWRDYFDLNEFEKKLAVFVD